MSTNTGTVTLDFGAYPGSNEASVAVTGQTNISASSKADVWVGGGSSTLNHTPEDHRYFGCFASLTCGIPTTGVGFTVYARSAEKLTGQWALQWVWAD